MFGISPYSKPPSNESQADQANAGQGAGAPRNVLPGEIQLLRLYTRKKAAIILGFKTRPGTLSEIPEVELRRCRVGPARGGVRYLGADLLAYILGQDMPEYTSLIEEARRTVIKPVRVKPLKKGERRRIV